MLIPIGIALFFFSTPTQRMRPVFILNAVSVAAGMVQGVLSVYNQVCFPHPVIRVRRESLTLPYFRVAPSWHIPFKATSRSSISSCCSSFHSSPTLSCFCELLRSTLLDGCAPST